MPAFAQRETALVVVGPIDPPRHTLTRAYIAEAERVARIIEQTGYQVERLYHPHATWQQVCQASRGASLFVYYGHGNGNGWHGLTDNESVNGLCLTHPDNPDALQAGENVPGGSAREIASLGLARGANVALIHTCYATGSSDTDTEAPQFAIAKQRVEAYAQAFFDAGAGNVVATSYVGITPSYFQRWLLEGTSIRQAFIDVMGNGQRTYSTPGTLIVRDGSIPGDPQPWAAALAIRPMAQPIRVVLASSAQLHTESSQTTTEQDQGRRLGDVMVMTPIAGRPPEQRDETMARWDSRWHSQDAGEREIGQQSQLVRALNDRLQLGNDFNLRLWWSYDASNRGSTDDLLARYRRQLSDKWIATSELQNRRTIGQPESLRSFMEVVPAAVDHSSSGDTVDGPPS
jgi:hypothetical protein